MFRAFLRSTGPIALLLVLALCTTPAVLVMPASTTTRSTDGVASSSGPDPATVVLAVGVTTLGVLALVAAGFLAYRRMVRRRAA